MIVQLFRQGVMLFAVALVISSITSITLFAEEALPAPPYLVANSQHIIVGVAFDEAAVREMLPPGIEPVDGITGGINIYTANDGWGVAPYTAAYFWVDIVGFDSADGTKARWMLQGVYGPATTSQALRVNFGWPVRTGSSTRESVGDNIRAIGMLNGRKFIEVVITPKPDSCQSIQSTLNYLGLLENGKVVTTQIPVIGDVCGADPVSVAINAPAGDPINKLKPVSVLWAIEFKNGYFSFSRPLWTP